MAACCRARHVGERLAMATPIANFPCCIRQTKREPALERAHGESEKSTNALAEQPVHESKRSTRYQNQPGYREQENGRDHENAQSLEGTRSVLMVVIGIATRFVHGIVLVLP